MLKPRTLATRRIGGFAALLLLLACEKNPSTDEPIATAMHHPSAPHSEARGPLTPLPPGTFEKNWGTVAQGSVLTHRFSLQVGEPLRVQRIRTGCACAVADPTVISPNGDRSIYAFEELIAIGSILELEVRVDTATRLGPLRIPLFVEIESSGTQIREPSSREVYADRVRLGLTATIEPLLAAIPANLEFGTVLGTDTSQGSITIVSTSGNPVGLSQSEQANLPAELSATLHPQSPDEHGRSASWTLDVRLEPGTPTGIHRFVIPFDFHFSPEHCPIPVEALPKAPFEATVVVHIVPPIRCVPNFVSFGIIRPNESAEQVVRIEASETVNLADLTAEIRVHRADNGPQMEPSLTAIESGNWQLHLTATGPETAKRSPFSGSVLLSFQQDGEPGLLELPYSGLLHDSSPSAR